MNSFYGEEETRKFSFFFTALDFNELEIKVHSAQVALLIPNLFRKLSTKIQGEGGKVTEVRSHTSV